MKYPDKVKIEKIKIKKRAYGRITKETKIIQCKPFTKQDFDNKYKKKVSKKSKRRKSLPRQDIILDTYYIKSSWKKRYAVSKAGVID